jgi:hypothetical protein
MTLYGLCHSNDVKIQNFQLNTKYLYSEQWHDIYLIITTYCYKIVLISSIEEGYIAMINSIDKISTRSQSATELLPFENTNVSLPLSRNIKEPYQFMS